MSPVLIVEDNEINAEIITMLLEEHGIPNELAVDGVDSIEKCITKPKDYYSLILMDIHMPRMNGYEAAKKIKKELGMTAPVVAQTATHTTEASIYEHRSYIDDYLFKPFKPEQLFSVISRYISII
ncbi:MAG TPA: response regulator [Treponema sp.]|nr:response regulator [Treponema sp.]